MTLLTAYLEQLVLWQVLFQRLPKNFQTLNFQKKSSNLLCQEPASGCEHLFANWQQTGQKP